MIRNRIPMLTTATALVSFVSFVPFGLHAEPAPKAATVAKGQATTPEAKPHGEGKGNGSGNGHGSGNANGNAANGNGNGNGNGNANANANSNANGESKGNGDGKSQMLADGKKIDDVAKARSDDKAKDDKAKAAPGKEIAGEPNDERLARVKVQHEAQRKKLRTVLDGPMSEPMRQELRHHAQRVARLERIKKIATEQKDTATLERVDKLLAKENARHDQWLSRSKIVVPTAVDKDKKDNADKRGAR